MAQTRNLTIVFTELPGRGDMLARHGEEGLKRRIMRHQGHVRRLMADCGGKEVEEREGSFFLVFEDPVRAVEFAVQLLSAHSAEPFLPKVRLGIHQGQVSYAASGASKPKVEGDAVNVASRLCMMADAEQILLSQTLFDYARRELDAAKFEVELAWYFHSHYHFSDMGRDVGVCEVGVPGVSPFTAPSQADDAVRLAPEDERLIEGWRPGRGLKLAGREDMRLVDLVRVAKKDQGYEVWRGELQGNASEYAVIFCFDKVRLKSLKEEENSLHLLRNALTPGCGVVRYDLWSFAEPPCWLVSDVLTPPTLKEWADSLGGLANVPMALRVDIVIQVCQAMSLLHMAGILVKDLDPQSIRLLTDDGGRIVVKLDALAARGVRCDGLSHARGAEAGNPFTAPERLEGKPASIQSDVFAAGALLYLVAAGNFDAPFDSEWPTRIEDEVLRKDIALCTAPIADARPGDPAHLGKRLRALEDRHRAMEAKREGERLERAKRRRQTTQKALKFAAPILAVLAVVGFFMVRDMQRSRELDLMRSTGTTPREQPQAPRGNGGTGSADLAYEQFVSSLLYVTQAIGEQRFAEAERRLLDIPVAHRNWEWGHAMKMVHPELIRFEGHDQALTDFDFSPDGTQLVTASLDNTAKVWDLATGDLSFTLQGHTKPITRVIFGNDGETIATLSHDQTLRFWNVATGRTYDISGLKVPVSAMEFSPDGTLLVLGFSDGSARMWTNRAEQQQDFSGHKGAITAIDFDDMGNRLVTVSADGYARIWDVNGQELRGYQAHSKPINDAMFSGDGTHFLTASADWTCAVRNVETGTLMTTLTSPDGPVLKARFSLDGTRVTTISDRSIRIWNAVSGDQLEAVTAVEDRFVSVDTSPDGSRLVTVSSSNVARIWDAFTGKLLSELSGHELGLKKAAFAPDGASVVTISERDPIAKLWDGVSGKATATLRGHDKLVANVDIGAGGTRLLTPSFDHSAKLWDVTTGREVFTLTGHTGPVSAARFNADSTRIVTASYDTTAIVWDAREGRELGSLTGHEAHINDLAISPDGRFAATASADATVSVWSLDSFAEELRLVGHEGAVFGVAFAPKGDLIATAGVDRSVRLWSARDGKELDKLDGHENVATRLAFSPDGKTLASASVDRTVRLWDVKTGKQRHVLTGHADSVSGVVFSPDGRRLMTSSSDKAIKVWDPSNGRELLTMRGRDEGLSGLALSPDGLTLAVASLDGTARLLPTIPWDPAKLPGDAGLPYTDKLTLWQQQRLAEWARQPSLIPAPPMSLSDIVTRMNGRVNETLYISTDGILAAWLKFTAWQPEKFLLLDEKGRGAFVEGRGYAGGLQPGDLVHLELVMRPSQGVLAMHAPPRLSARGQRVPIEEVGSKDQLSALSIPAMVQLSPAVISGFSEEFGREGFAPRVAMLQDSKSQQVRLAFFEGSPVAKAELTEGTGSVTGVLLSDPSQSYAIVPVSERDISYTSQTAPEDKPAAEDDSIAAAKASESGTERTVTGQIRALGFPSAPRRQVIIEDTTGGIILDSVPQKEYATLEQIGVGNIIKVTGIIEEGDGTAFLTEISQVRATGYGNMLPTDPTLVQPGDIGPEWDSRLVRVNALLMDDESPWHERLVDGVKMLSARTGGGEEVLIGLVPPYSRAELPDWLYSGRIDLIGFCLGVWVPTDEESGEGEIIHLVAPMMYDDLVETDEEEEQFETSIPMP